LALAEILEKGILIVSRFSWRPREQAPSGHRMHGFAWIIDGWDGPLHPGCFMALKSRHNGRLW